MIVSIGIRVSIVGFGSIRVVSRAMGKVRSTLVGTGGGGGGGGGGEGGGGGGRGVSDIGFIGNSSCRRDIGGHHGR